MFCASTDGEHAENAGTAADIKDNLVLEDVLILVDGITIRPSTDIVFQHLLMNAMMIVASKVANFSVVSTNHTIGAASNASFSHDVKD
jgi:hypothetical protein